MLESRMPDVRENLERVRERIARAATRAGRRPDDVLLIGVSKTVDVERIRAALAAGLRALGENRVQEAKTKVAELGRPAAWHLIGHLQTNKVRRALPCFDVLHSLDRRSLVEALAAETSRAGRGPLPVFIQVNVSGESSKGGFEMNALWDALGTVRDTGRFDVQGLMTMAPLEGGADAARPVFRRLRELRDEALGRRYLGAPNLSMGMSQDFETAVEEGATHVRVGSLLFS